MEGMKFFYTLQRKDIKFISILNYFCPLNNYSINDLVYILI